MLIETSTIHFLNFHAMKKIRSVTGMGLVALTLFMGSCVSKKKYVAAQNEIERYRTDSTQMAQRSAEMQQNITSLEETTKSWETRYDSANKAYEAKWAGVQTYFNEQKTAAEQLHQSIHQSLSNSEVIGADAITSGNGKVYITLDEKVFSGTSLNKEGREAIAQFANAVNSKENVAVDVVTGDSYAAYWNSGSSMGNTSGNWSTASGADSSMTSGNNDASVTAKVDEDNASVSATTGNTTRTASTARTTTNKSKTYTAKKSTAKKSYATTKRRTGEAGRSTSMRTGTKSKTTASNSWNSKLAKASSIAKELHKNGLNSVGLMIPAGENGTGENSTKFQLIVSPKDSRYYQLMEQNNTNNTSGSTNGSMNK
jgi:hypothetical protein